MPLIDFLQFKAIQDSLGSPSCSAAVANAALDLQLAQGILLALLYLKLERIGIAVTYPVTAGGHISKGGWCVSPRKPSDLTSHPHQYEEAQWLPLCVHTCVVH